MATLNNEPTEYAINFDKVLADPGFSTITKMTLVMIQGQPYMTLGEYFQRLSNRDLETLLEIGEDAIQADEDDDVNAQAVRDLIVMSEALAIAEGAPAQSEAEAHLNLNYFMMLANCVSLERKGLVDIKYDKLSFGTDMKSEGVVRIKPGVDPEDYDE